jgi:tetratricopeptide (TPR) repeat protein
VRSDDVSIFEWGAFVRRVLSIAIGCIAILVVGFVQTADAVGAGAASASGDAPVIDVIADNAFSARKAILEGDYATALKITADVLSQSKIGNWRFDPFAEFITDLKYIRGPDLGKNLDEWVARDKMSAIPLLLRAQYFYDKGWATRGHEFASETQTDRMTAFSDYMAKALADVEAALRLDEHNPYAFHLKLRILLGYGNTPVLKAAFEAAQAKFPDFYPLYDVYLNALEPKWGGSVLAMYDFVDRYAGTAPEHSPLKLLYLNLYGRLLNTALVRCGQYRRDPDWTAQCASAVMRETVKPQLETQVSAALQLYDHTDRYQFGVAVHDLLAGMLRETGGETFSGDILEQAAAGMHSDTQLKENGPGHNNYIIDEVVAESWNNKGFYENALTKYQEALVDAQAGEFPGDRERNLAIASIYEQLAAISGNRLHLYNDMIEYEKSAIARGMTWDEHYICYAYYELRRYKEAIDSCSSVIRRDTENPEARYWRGRAYRDSGNKDAASQDFTVVADSDGPLSATSAIEVSTIDFGRNDNKGALDVLNKYTFLYDVHRTSKSDVAVAYNNRCYAYMQLGDLEKALNDCTSSLKYGSIPDAYRKQQELVKRLGQ